MNFQAIVSINPTQGGNFTPNKNGVMPVALKPVNGKVPAHRVANAQTYILDGTVAQITGLVPGKLAWVSFDELEANEYGRNFRVTKIADISPMDALTAGSNLGAPEMVNCVGKKEEKSEETASAAGFAESKF